MNMQEFYAVEKRLIERGPKTKQFHLDRIAAWAGADLLTAEEAADLVAVCNRVWPDEVTA